MEGQWEETLALHFDLGQTDAPYAGNEACAEELLALLALHLTAAGAGKAYAGQPEAEGWNLPGAAMEGEEAARYVANYLPFESPLGDDACRLLEAAWAHVAGRLAASAGGAGGPAMARLKAALSLSPFAFFCLLCAWGCGEDRGFERVFAALGGADAARGPLFGAVCAVWRLARPLGEADTAFFADGASAECRLLFAPADEALPPALRPLTLRPAVRSLLAGGPCLGPVGSRLGRVPAAPAAPPLFIGGQVAAVKAFVAPPAAPPAPRLMILCGESGAGKKLSLGQVSAETGRAFLLLRPAQAEGPAEWEDLAAELALAGVLGQYVLCFALGADDDRAALLFLLERLRPWALPVLLLAERLKSNVVAPGYRTARADYPPLDLEQSLAAWRHFLPQGEASGAGDAASAEPGAGEAAPAPPDPEKLAARFRLTPGQICRAVDSALAAAAGRGQPLDEGHLGEAVLLGTTSRLSEITDRIATLYTWRDLVLPESAVQTLRDACDRVRYRRQVEQDWGFAGRAAYGRGVSILLYGPPGTGKTMSAQVLAGELGLPLYRINLSQIISKYIGETAKNLDAVFNEARSGNVVLFFDEADALFARRTEVKSSNDRHANSESSYLLQKMEDYPGVCILATNLAHNFDEAFRRRIMIMVNIHMPAAPQREAIWRGSFPPAAPLAPGVDFALLARELEISGSVIKAAALQAAYFAARDGGDIAMHHIARALRQELQKLGKVEPAFLTAY